MANPPKVLTDFNAVVDGQSLSGLLSEAQLPKLAYKADAMQMAGMDLPTKFPTGMEEQNFMLTTAEPNQDLLAAFGSEPRAVSLLGIYQWQDEFLRFSADMEVRFLSENERTFKPNENTSYSLEGCVDKYTLVQEGEEVRHIDVFGHIRRINGVDQLATQRQHCQHT